MKTIILFSTILLTSSLMTGCMSSMPLAGMGGAPDTEVASINQKRGAATAHMNEAQRKQYERQQNMELREAQLQAEKERLARQRQQVDILTLPKGRGFLSTAFHARKG